VVFLPLMVKGPHVSTNWIRLAAVLPYISAFVAITVWGWRFDITGKRF
jgi:hypothetical protein